MPAATVVSDADLERALRAAGLKSTRPRLLVLRYLRESGGHHSADEITDALTALDTSLQRGSVYNVLNKLEQHGLVSLADVGPGRALYESGSTWHHHFVCRRCDAVIDVPCVVGHKPCLDAELDGAELDEAQIIFRGLCSKCVQAGQFRLAF
jgi:Fur family ferric uptake transcriptional regulator